MGTSPALEKSCGQLMFSGAKSASHFAQADRDIFDQESGVPVRPKNPRYEKTTYGADYGSSVRG